MQNTPALLAVLMVIAMRWLDIASIARWRRFVAFKEATKCRHLASTRFNIIQSDMPTPVVS
jgi:hypothetical protein